MMPSAARLPEFEIGPAFIASGPISAISNDGLGGITERIPRDLAIAVDLGRDPGDGLAVDRQRHEAPFIGLDVFQHRAGVSRLVADRGMNACRL